MSWKVEILRVLDGTRMLPRSFPITGPDNPQVVKELAAFLAIVREGANLAKREIPAAILFTLDVIPAAGTNSTQWLQRRNLRRPIGEKPLTTQTPTKGGPESAS